MKSRLHAGVWSAVMVSASLAAAVSCGSDDGKKVNRDEQVGGQGGAGAPSSAGTPTTEGGAGGAPRPEGGTGNAGGEPTQPTDGGGAGGESTEAGGAGGQPPVSSCVPSGATLLPNVDSEPIYSVCRGARLVVPVTAEDTDETFTCCGVSNAVPAWGTDFLGRDYVATGGSFLFEISKSAPLGAQSMTIDCLNGPVGGAIQLNVVEGAPPVVTGVTTPLVSGDTMFVDGSNLSGVTDAWAIAPDGSQYECIIISEGNSDTSFGCFFDAIPTGTYRLRVNEEGCGLATIQFEFEVVPGA